MKKETITIIHRLLKGEREIAQSNLLLFIQNGRIDYKPQIDRYRQAHDALMDFEDYMEDIEE